MKVLLTGSSGRIGRAIRARLAHARHEVVGVDIAPSPATDVVASVEDAAALRAALRGCDSVVHTAALHAPQVGQVDDARFEAVNVTATATLARLCAEAGVGRLVYTSTTALYGATATARGAAWVTEDTEPMPRTVYHRTKLRAEAVLEAAATRGLAVVALRMARCFPEPAPRMAAYRLHRGVDARDVAEAHAQALLHATPGFRRFVVSAATPFVPEDVDALAGHADDVIRRRMPALAETFARRGWPLPTHIDRVYCAARAQDALGWTPVHGFESVLADLDRGAPEVLAPA